MFPEIGKIEINLTGLTGILMPFMGQIGKYSVFRMPPAQWGGSSDNILIKSFESTSVKVIQQGLTVSLLLPTTGRTVEKDSEPRLLTGAREWAEKGAPRGRTGAT